jgi:hypothetical protein
VRDEEDDRDDEKNVDQRTSYRHGDETEEPKHQDHAGDHEQHFESRLSRESPLGSVAAAAQARMTIPSLAVRDDGSVMQRQGSAGTMAS